MNYAEIKNCDIANGTGVRISLFVSGCTHHCRECFNEEAWDFHYGKPFTAEASEQILKELAPDYIHGLTLLGGEPMEPSNQEALLPFLEKVKEIYPQKDIWCYTGYVYGEGNGRQIPKCPETQKLLSLLDVLVDGPFILEEKDISLRFRGSKNQRIIDMKQTIAQGRVVLWQGK